MKPIYKKLLQYAIAVTVGAVFFFTVFILNSGFSAASPSALYKILSDSFIVPGVALIGSYVLAWIGNQGTFNFLNYTVQRVGSKFFHTIEAGRQTYGEFCEARANKEKKNHVFLLFVGFAFLLVGLIFIPIYYNAAAEEGLSTGAFAAFLI